MDYFFDNYYVYSSYVPTDIYPVLYGQQQCRPGHDFGPCVRNNYIIHYVYDGKGVFVVNGTEYEVNKNQMFLIKPNQLAYYRADSENPWLYRWIEFNGSMAESILSVFSSPVLTDDGRIGKNIEDIVKMGDMPFELLMQKLWTLISSLTHSVSTAPNTHSEEYIRKAIAYIKGHIHKKITVGSVACHVGIDRSYLSRLFKEYKNVSPQQYILNLKMNAAAQYLKNTDISVEETANSVGYDDYHVFNKVFKSHFGLSPSKWRKKEFWEQSIVE